MKILILITSVIFMSQTTLATQLTCLEKLANVVTKKITVDLDLGKKVSLFTADGNSSYITERKSGFFSLELFMGSREQRLYSEGPISAESALILAIWTRDELIEIECSK